MKFRLIAAEKAFIPVARACRLLGVSESGYYAWASRGASRRQREDMLLLARIREAFRLSHGTYGSPRMTIEMQDAGHSIGRRRVARLMRENRLKARQPRRYRRCGDSAAAGPMDRRRPRAPPPRPAGRSGSPSGRRP